MDHYFFLNSPNYSNYTDLRVGGQWQAQCIIDDPAFQCYLDGARHMMSDQQPSGTVEGMYSIEPYESSIEVPVGSGIYIDQHHHSHAVNYVTCGTVDVSY